ncbi:MAG: hypothetical protein RhofKO_25310 [Rhodothermales bacterium]
MPDLADTFLSRSRHYLMDEYLPKLERCLDQLSEDEVWWRPNEASNSVGNLILHLAGNIRQWVIAGVGQQADVRQRQAEFDEAGPVPTEALRLILRQTLTEVDATLAAVAPASLLEPRSIQGYDVSVFEAIYHAVEHFSTHVGQVVYITKLWRAADLKFYRTTPDGLAYPNW